MIQQKIQDLKKQRDWNIFKKKVLHNEIMN